MWPATHIISSACNTALLPSAAATQPAGDPQRAVITANTTLLHNGRPPRVELRRCRSRGCGSSGAGWKRLRRTVSALAPAPHGKPRIPLAVFVGDAMHRIIVMVNPVGAPYTSPPDPALAALTAQAAVLPPHTDQNQGHSSQRQERRLGILLVSVSGGRGWGVGGDAMPFIAAHWELPGRPAAAQSHPASSVRKKVSPGPLRSSPAELGAWLLALTCRPCNSAGRATASANCAVDDAPCATQGCTCEKRYEGTKHMPKGATGLAVCRGAPAHASLAPLGLHAANVLAGGSRAVLSVGGNAGTVQTLQVMRSGCLHGAAPPPNPVRVPLPPLYYFAPPPSRTHAPSPTPLHARPCHHHPLSPPSPLSPFPRAAALPCPACSKNRAPVEYVQSGEPFVIEMATHLAGDYYEGGPGQGPGAGARECPRGRRRQMCGVEFACACGMGGGGDGGRGGRAVAG